MRFAWAGLVAVVGCGRIGFDFRGGSGNGSDGDAIVADPDATTTSGTRLQVRYWVTPDGARLFASFYDPVIGSRCAFQADSSGTQRCFPSEVLTTFSYADAACATPTLRVATGCASTPMMATVASGTGYKAVTLGASTPGFLGIFTCTAATDGAAYHLVGSDLPDSMFVAATQTTVPLADGLGRLELVAEDGARQTLGYAYGGVPCRVVKIGATTASCFPQMPEAFTGPRMYSDAACTTEVAPIGGTPPFATVLDAESMCRGARYVSTGSQQVLSTLHVRDSTGGCSAITQTSMTYTAFTDVTSTLPVLSRVIDAGTTRDRTWAWISPGGARLEAGLYDTMLSAPCTPTTDDTGMTTCATVAIPRQVAHNNTMCNMPPPVGEALCDGADTTQGTAVTPSATHATCDGLGIAMTTYSTPAAFTMGYDSYAGACVPMDLADAGLFTTTTVPYQPSRFARLTLQ